MKKCDYCAKEISYYDQYCSVECEKKALEFYSLRERFTKLFLVLNIICIFSIPVGFIFSIFPGVSTLIPAIALTILGITIFLLPFPVENMITSMKIQKAVKVTRIVGIICFSVGVIILILWIIFR